MSDETTEAPTTEAPITVDVPAQTPATTLEKVEAWFHTHIVEPVEIDYDKAMAELKKLL